MTLSHDQSFGIPIVAVEETMRGWLAAIAKERLAQPPVADAHGSPFANARLRRGRLLLRHHCFLEQRNY
jgi:hypothetical protein